MQELPIIADSELRQGLAPRRTGIARANSVYLTQVEGLRSGQYGLEGAPLYTDPFNGLVSVDWPFPQLWNGEEDTLLLGKTSVKRVTKAAGQWTLTNLTTYNTNSPSSTLAIPSGGVWHTVDLGDTWYMFNGSCILFRTGLEQLKGSSEKVWVNSSVTIKTGCTHKGRVVIGGLSSSNLFSGQLISLVMKQLQASVKDDFTTTYSSIDSNYVLWSSIGGGDFPLWLILPLNTPTEFAPTLDRLVESMKRGEWGFSRCTFQGEVLVVKELGNHFIAYGKDGITAFTFTPGGGDIPPTYGRRHIGDIGLYDRGSVSWGPNLHVFLDKSGSLWSLSEDLQISRLDYREYFTKSIEAGEEFVGTYDPHFGDHYLSTSTSTFIYNPVGISAELRPELCRYQPM